MLTIRNNAALTAAVAMAASGTQVPFDTTVYSTNGNAALKANAVNIPVPGMYMTDCTVGLSNTGSAAVNAVLTLYAGGEAVDGAAITATIPATTGYAEIKLSYPVKVVGSASGVANVYWVVSGAACSLANAVATITKVV